MECGDVEEEHGQRLFQRMETKLEKNWKQHGKELDTPGKTEPFTDVTTYHNWSNGKLKSVEPLKIRIEMNFDIFDPSNQWNHHESSMETVSPPFLDVQHRGKYCGKLFMPEHLGIDWGSMKFALWAISPPFPVDRD